MNNIKKLIPEINITEEKLIKMTLKYSMTSIPSIWTLIKSTKYILKNNIPGDFVECGIWKGGNVILIKKLLFNLKKSRKIFCYDTFEGLTEPDSRDEPWHNRYNTKEVWEKKNKKNHNDWCYSSYDSVLNNFKKELKNFREIKLIKGKVEDTLKIKKNLPKKISLLRLDTDWYKSTKVELEKLYPLLAKGGILLIDDYGHWKGARKATDEYFKNSKILMSRIDYTCRMIIK